MATSHERGNGVGEREGSADMSMGKEKMNFDFFLIQQGPTEAWLFNTHRKAYMIVTQQTLCLL